MELINEITADCFNAINQLRTLQVAVDSPERVAQQLCGFVDRFRQEGRSRGLPDRDVEDMMYAIVALADEVAQGTPEPLRSHWIMRPLQMLYFNENLAGDGFFDRLAKLRAERRRTEVLKVYYLCLLFGFQGRYAIRGGEGELLRIIEGLRSDLEATIEWPESLAPAGEPPDEPLVPRGDRNPVLWLSLAVLAAGIGLFVMLKVMLDGRVTEVADRVESLTR